MRTYMESAMLSGKVACKTADVRLALGLDDYRLWHEINWPGNSYWRTDPAAVLETATTALDNMDAVRKGLTCGCKLPEESCPVCRARARLAVRA